VSDSGVKAPVVAVIDWRAAAALKGNAGLLRRAGLLSGARPRRQAPTTEHRSLVVRADGAAELRRFTAATTARRLVSAVEDSHTRKAGTGRRG
jgi:hypothetical protein